MVTSASENFLPGRRGTGSENAPMKNKDRGRDHRPGHLEALVVGEGRRFGLARLLKRTEDPG